MTKTIGIETDPKDGRQYLSLREGRSDPDSKHITVETQRNQIIITEHEGRVKRCHNGNEYRENRPSMFKGPDAPAKAARYLIQKYNLSVIEIRGHP